MATSTQQQQWVLRAQVHDREALELLLKSIQPSLHRFIRSIAGPVDADDILQDVFIQICRKLTWLRAPELFQAWAFRIAGRAAVRHLKRQKRWIEKELEDAVEGTIVSSTDVPWNELTDLVLNGSGLSTASRAVLVLHFIDGWTLPEVAAILEIPLGTVKSRLAFGLTNLRKQLMNKRSL